MTTKPALVFALFLASTVAFDAACAETYQWKDSNGQTVVSDVPPPASAKDRRSIGGRQPAVVSEQLAEKPADGAKTAEAPKTIAEQELDFKRRQQEARENADKQAKEQAAATNKRENCERARSNLAALKANQPLTTYDDKGERKLMDTMQREQEIARARRFMAESCQ
jgi:hypothetical protein